MFFEHYKGKYYQQIGYVKDANSDETMVLYIPLYASECIFFVREYSNFFEMIEDKEGVRERFRAIVEKDITEESREFILDIKEVGEYLARTNAKNAMLSE